MTALLAGLAGSNIIYGLGMIDSGMVFDYGQMVIDNEIAAGVKRVCQGIDVNDTALAVDIIKEIDTGSYIAHKSTLQNMRNVSDSKLINRMSRSSWEAAGSKDIHAVATEMAREIIQNHQPAQLDEKIISQVNEIVSEAEKELLMDKKK